MHLTLGSLVGPYRILAPLGAGGMGEVYRARDEKLSRDVALKILSADLASNADHLRRFQQEAHAASALNHPNIITIYDIGHFDGTAYIAMELVDGQDLRSLQTGDRLPIKNVLRVAVKVADGLAAAHERGIVHRDLKPENVMISRDGFVKILDFGLAKLVRPITESQTTAPHTTPGAVFGTVAYMSPEQAAGRNLDFRSDQFSLGVILYEMLTARMPFSEPTAAETLAAIIRHDAPPASSLNDSIPPELQRIVDRCLAKDPGDRYASTRDLARDLREVRDRTSNASEPRYRSDRSVTMPARRVAWIGAVIAAAVIATVIGVWKLRAPVVVTPPRVQQGPLSVAILPFKDLSGTADSQIFADGIAEMIRSRLGESRTVRVITAFDRASQGDPPSVARSLGAAYAVTGAVQRLGNTVHLSVSLIDAKSGVQTAGETFSGNASDVFALQNRAVNVVLTGMNVRRDTNERTIPAELSSAEDQSAYVEAIGLLQRAKDESSIDRATATLEKLLMNARDSAPVNAQLARALLYKSQLSRRPGLIQQATLYAERAVELDDSQSEVHVRLGQLRNMAGRYADAEREFRRALELRNDNADAYLGLGETYEGMGRAAAAEEMYRKAMALRPEHANTYDRYAAFLFNSGRPQEAAANFLHATQLMPTARGFNNLGGAYQSLGRYDDAKEAYQKSIALAPNSDAYVNLGLLDYYEGHYPHAAQSLEEGARLARGSHQAWLALGDTYRWSGAREKSRVPYENAIKTARDAIAVNPRDAVAHATCANALVKLGRTAEAESEMTAALKLDPTNQSVRYDAAVVALIRGNSDVAVDWLQRAVSAGYPVADLQRDPEFQSIHADPSFPSQATRKK